MTLLVNSDGKDLTGFTSFSLTRSMDDFLDAFDLKMTISAGVSPVIAGSVLKFYLDGVLASTCYADSVEVSYGATTHDIIVKGRGVAQDLVDGHIGPDLRLVAPISLPNVAAQVVKIMGLSLSVSSPENFDIFEKGEVISAEADSKGFEFLQKWAMQRQALITADEEGNILLTRAGDTPPSSQLLRLKDDPKNNVLSSNSKIDLSKRYNYYQVNSELNFSQLSSADDALGICTQFGTALDPEIRSTRKLYLSAEQPGASKVQADRAKWESNIRRARGTRYQAVTQGFSRDSGSLWEANSRVQVEDDFASIAAAMIIRTVEFTYSVGSGEQTAIFCAPPDGYRVQAARSNTEKRYDKTLEDYGG